jgi:hypothetical protein
MPSRALDFPLLVRGAPLLHFLSYGIPLNHHFYDILADTLKEGWICAD